MDGIKSIIGTTEENNSELEVIETEFIWNEEQRKKTEKSGKA